MSERTTCNRADRDSPKLVCAQPLPCPYHTAILDLSKPGVVLLVGDHLDIKAAKRLITIGRKLTGARR